MTDMPETPHEGAAKITEIIRELDKTIRNLGLSSNFTNPILAAGMRLVYDNPDSALDRAAREGQAAKIMEAILSQIEPLLEEHQVQQGDKQGDKREAEAHSPQAIAHMREAIKAAGGDVVKARKPVLR